MATWSRDINLFTKQYIYFPIVSNGHYVLAVADIPQQTLISYDPLGISRTPLLKLLLRYLFDEFHMLVDRGEEGQPPLPFDEFDVDQWKFVNMFDSANRMQLNNSDCGLFLLKFTEVLQVSGDISTITQSHVPMYRQEFTSLIENFTE